MVDRQTRVGYLAQHAGDAGCRLGWGAWTWSGLVQQVGDDHTFEQGVAGLVDHDLDASCLLELGHWLGMAITFRKA